MKPHIEYHFGRWFVYAHMFAFNPLGRGHTLKVAWADYLCGKSRAL